MEVLAWNFAIFVAFKQLRKNCTSRAQLSGFKELEEDLGVQLFVRTTRSTRLTRAGRLFQHHVPRVFAALEQARDSAKAAAQGFNGQLRIALSATAFKIRKTRHGIWPVGKIRVKTCHIDRMLLRQARTSRHYLGL